MKCDRANALVSGVIHVNTNRFKGLNKANAGTWTDIRVDDSDGSSMVSTQHAVRDHGVVATRQSERRDLSAE